MTRYDNPTIAGDGIALCRPQLADGKAVHELVRRCPPLDLNSSYGYFLLCSHFADTCVVARQGTATVGFLSAYRMPQAPQTLFVWQVAVAEQARGRGLAGRMLGEVLSRRYCEGVQHVATTISPSNHASRQVFARFAAAHDAGWHEEPFLTAAHFGAESHEDEVLIRIGPLIR